MTTLAETERFTPQDLQALQETLAAHHIALAELVAVVRRYPRTIAIYAKETKGA